MQFVPEYFKTQEVCDKAFEKDFLSLKFIPDWFVTQRQIKIWYDDYFYDDDCDEVLWWYKGYKKFKEQKAQIKKELLPIAWHLDRVMDWCMLEDKNRCWK